MSGLLWELQNLIDWLAAGHGGYFWAGLSVVWIVLTVLLVRTAPPRRQ